MSETTFRIKRDDLINLKHNNYEMYQFVMSLSDGEKSYCESLDKEKLKSECALGYFNIADLFTKEQIKKASVEQGFKAIDQRFGGESKMVKTKIKPCPEATAIQEQCWESMEAILKVIKN